MKLSIIIPIYNEENTISKIVDIIKKIDLGKIDKEIVVVDDGSNDNSLNVLKTIKNIKLIAHQRNKGKGAAIKTAIKHSTGDIIIIQDADLEYDPNDYLSLITPIIKGKAQVVYGSRRLKKDNQKHSGLSFYLGGISLTWITNIIYPTAHITDEPTCYKVFKTNILKSIKLNCRKFEFCPEVTAKVLKKGIKIHEVPISYYPRSVKEGKKIKAMDWFEAVWALVKYRFVN
jgi:dolichol-phosphate mannosyltransferase